MGEALAGGSNFNHGLVGGSVVTVAALLSSPSEDVVGEIRIRLGLEGSDNVGRGEARAEVGYPGIELLLERGSTSNVRDLG